MVFILFIYWFLNNILTISVVNDMNQRRTALQNNRIFLNSSRMLYNVKQNKIVVPNVDIN